MDSRLLASLPSIFKEVNASNEWKCYKRVRAASMKTVNDKKEAEEVSSIITRRRVGGPVVRG